MYALRTALRAPNAVRATRAFATTPARFNGWAKNPTVDAAEFNKLVKQPTEDVLLIDTREPDDVVNSPISGTVSLPLSKVASALAENNNPGQFQNDFSFSKPTYAQKMVFLDGAAKRAQAAAEAAKKAGYNNVRTYGGSIKEHQ